jgi:enoyl-CoA hydratase/carnithine racemase
MEDRVRIEHKDGIADVRMVRADKMNALDPAMFHALVAAGTELCHDRSVRAVVLSGEGRSFCAGLDMATMAQTAGGGGGGGAKLPKIENLPDTPAGMMQLAAWIWQEVPVPVIAAVHGAAYGAGLQVAMGADIRFVAPDAKLTIRETYWGLIPDVALTATFRNIVGIDIAKELTFTGRVISGEEAVAYRLATHVSDDPHADAMKLAQEIAQRSPDAIRASKQLWNQAPQGSLAEGLQLELKLQSTVIGGANQREAVAAGMEKRAPHFSDPE